MPAQQNTAKKLIDLERQRHVAGLRLRGLSQREIQLGLMSPDINCINKDTGQPWSLGTINHDIKVIERIWAKECAASVDKHKARLVALLGEVIRRGWQLDDLDKVLRAVKQQGEIFGVDAPKRTAAELTAKDGAPLLPAPQLDLSKLTDAQLKNLESILVAVSPDAGGSTA